jgi:lauroyl/myristoyl acyltransferase
MAISPTEAQATTEHRARQRPLLTLKDIAWLAYVYPLRWLSLLMPAEAVRGIGRLAEPLSQLLTLRDKARMEAALRRAYGHGPAEEELRQIARRWVAMSVRWSFGRLARTHARSAEGYYRVQLRGLDKVKLALAGGRGAIIASGHFVATGLLREALTAEGFRLLVVVAGKRLDWALGRLGVRFVGPRLRLGSPKPPEETVRVDDRDCTLKIAGHLRAGGLVFIMIDASVATNVTRRPFLGGHLGFSIGFLEIARQMGCPVIPAFPAGDGRSFTLNFEEPLELSPASSREEFADLNIRPLVSWLESRVIEYPDQWAPWLLIEP